MARGPVHVKNHRVLPLEARLLDANGVEVGAGIAAPPVLRVVHDPGEGSPVDVTESALPAGRGTAAGAFSLDAGSGTWPFNLATRSDAAPGTYHLSIE
jgi:hypothetical protein